MSDLEVLKDIPGYKAILKSVLKSQIQLLMEQLSEHAGEEAIVLTASVNDGSLSHLGSSTGKGFFEGRDEIKSQFLGYCLKTYHKQKTREPSKPYQRKHPSPRTSPSTQPAKRPCVYPVGLSQSPADTYSSSMVSSHGMPEPRISQTQNNNDSNLDLSVGNSGDASGDMGVKTELNDQNTSNSDTTSVTPGAEFLPSSIHLSHTQVASETNDGANNDETDNEQSKMPPIKVEQVEDELEITGVEMAAGNFDTWGQGQPGYIPEGGDSSFSMGADQSAYNVNEMTEILYNVDKSDSTGDVQSNSHLVSWSSSNNFSNSLPQYDHNTYSASQLLEKKEIRGKPSSAQLQFHASVRDAATYASIWQGAPSLAEIPSSNKGKYFEAIEQTLPQLRGNRRELWRRLGECLQNRRRYLKNKSPASKD